MLISSGFASKVNSSNFDTGRRDAIIFNSSVDSIDGVPPPRYIVRTGASPSSWRRIAHSLDRDSTNVALPLFPEVEKKSQ